MVYAAHNLGIDEMIEFNRYEFSNFTLFALLCSLFLGLCVSGNVAVFITHTQSGTPQMRPIMDLV